MPIRLIDKWSVGETLTEATETVALPGTQKLSVNRIGMECFDYCSKSPSSQKVGSTKLRARLINGMKHMETG